MTLLMLWGCAPPDSADSADTAPAAARLVASAEALDFGEVPLGCAPELTLGLQNAADADLTLTALSIDAAQVQARGADGALAFPITLAPGGVLELQVGWAPEAAGALAGELRVEADEALSLPLAGTAYVDREATSTFTVEALQDLTVLVALHKQVATDARFAPALPTFFATLQGSGARHRVALLTHETGAVDGPTPYIDQDDTPEAATAAALTMIATPDRDLDRILAALDAGFTAQRGWLVDESPEWAASRLSMIGMNFDIEQSPADWRSYLDGWTAEKPDGAGLVISGMGGDVPRGCGSFALPFEAFYDAAAATGGAFVSICEEDWAPSMEDLARAAIGGTRFALEGSPSAASVRVQLDGVELTDGWSYEPAARAVEFERYPPAGATVQVDYLTADACPGD